jgi:hypothetical protein
MPTSVAIAAAASYAGSTAAAAAVGAGWFAAGSIGASLLSGAVGIAVSYAGNALMADKPDSGQSAGQLDQEVTNRNITVRQAVAPWQWIYGQARVAGILTYMEDSPVTGHLHMVITLAGHECEELGDVWFDDEVVPLDGSGEATGRFAGYVRVKKSLGGEAAGVQPFPDLVAESAGLWGPSHCQTGRAKLYVRLLWNPDLFPQGIPNIRCTVKGRKVYDPRSATTVWSANAALCVSDYLTAAVGLGCTYASEINETQLIAAANICDESVTLAAGGTESRYTMNGAFAVNASPREVLPRLLTSIVGNARFLGGTWGVYPAAYATPSATALTQDDLRAGIRVQPRLSKRDLANRIKGIYVSPDNDWQASDYPPVTNATYLAEDQAEVLWRELDLPFTTSAATAQRLAKIELERIRQQITVTWPGKLTCYRLQPGDTVPVTLSRYGWSSKIFEVVSQTLTFEESGEGVVLGCDLVLRETASAVFDWNSGEETTVDPAPDTNLPDPFTVAAPANVNAESGTDELFVMGDGTVITRIRVQWSQPLDYYVEQGGRVLVQFKPASGSTWLDAAPVAGDADEAWITGVQDGIAYDLRVRFENALGTRSDWTQIAHTVIGKSAAPADVSLFTIEGTRLTWTPVSDADVRAGGGYRLKFHFGVNRSWGDANALHNGIVTDSPFDLQIIPSGATTLMIKAVDSSDNESENPAVILWNFGDPIVANVVETFDLKAAGFVGTTTNGSVSGGNLVADVLASPLMWNANSSANFWSWDSAALLWATTMYKQMTYVDSVTITEALSGSRLTIEATVAGDPWSLEYRENSQKAMWDADGATVMWSTDTSTLWWDAPAWTTWPGSIEVSDTIIDVRITTGQATTQGEISELTVTVDAPDIVENLDDVSILAAGTRLSLTKTFAVIKNVQLTVQNDGGTAITARTEDKNATLGPLIKCLDAAGSATTGLVDARVQGY